MHLGDEGSACITSLEQAPDRGGSYSVKHPYDGAFEVLNWGTLKTTETRSRGSERETLVCHFEHPVTVRHTLACRQCGQRFSYDFKAALRWETSDRRQVDRRDALEQLLARERQRVLSPGWRIPVVCPHCHAVQGDRDRPLTGLVARVLGWVKGQHQVP